MAAPPTRPALRARYEGRRRAVVDAAARIFAERGYHGTSMADLLAATGLTSGGLYHYIGSKEQLLVRIVDELMEPLLAELRDLCAGDAQPAEERLRRFVRTWLAHVERHLDHMRVFQQERHVMQRQPHWGHVRRQRQDFEELLEGVLRRLEREDLLRPPDHQLALLALLGMVNHTSQWLHPGGRLTAEQIADGYCDILLGRGASPLTPPGTPGAAS